MQICITSQINSLCWKALCLIIKASSPCLLFHHPAVQALAIICTPRPLCCVTQTNSRQINIRPRLPFKQMQCTLDPPYSAFRFTQAREASLQTQVMRTNQQFLEKKRKEPNPPKPVSRIKRLRRNSKHRQPPSPRPPLLAKTTPQPPLESTPVQTPKIWGPEHPYQFENKNAEVCRISEDDLTKKFSRVLYKICSKNEDAIPRFTRADAKPPYRSKKYPDGSSSLFYSLHRPEISLRDYLFRFVRYMNVSRSVFVVGLIYLDRVKTDDELLALTPLNAQRLITTALSTACKFLEDESHRNSCLSRIGGVPSKEEMNMLEIQFLRRLNWNCSVPQLTYQLYEDSIFGDYENKNNEDAETTISTDDSD